MGHSSTQNPAIRMKSALTILEMLHLPKIMHSPHIWKVLQKLLKFECVILDVFESHPGLNSVVSQI